jgi:hypothetical protein
VSRDSLVNDGIPIAPRFDLDTAATFIFGASNPLVQLQYVRAEAAIEQHFGYQCTTAHMSVLCRPSLLCSQSGVARAKEQTCASLQCQCRPATSVPLPI